MLARQIAREMEEPKSEMAKRMQTSRGAVDRLLDRENNSVTLATLFKAATAVGREISVGLV